MVATVVKPMLSTYPEPPSRFLGQDNRRGHMTEIEN